MIDFATRTGNLLSFYIAAGGFFSVLFAGFMMFAVREKGLIHYLHAGFFFVLGFCIICDPYYRLGTENLTPHLLYINFPLVLLIGPLFFLYMKSIFDNKFRLSKVHLLFLIPTVIAVIAFIPYYFLPLETKLATFPLEFQPRGYYRSLAIAAEYIIFPWNLLCMLLALKNNMPLIGRQNRIFNLTFLFSLAVSAVTIVLAYFDTLEDLRFYKYALSGIVSLSIVLAGFTARFPSYFIRIRMEASAAKYTQSKLKSLNVDALISRIEDLMDLEQLYKDPEISLSSLSERLELNTQQLSEIINSRFKLNFNSYINGFRIEAAKKLLIHDAESSILSIALSCGFNSKSNFNRVFQMSVGSTPTEYRRNSL